MKQLNIYRQFMVAAMLALLCYGCKKMEEDKARVKITGGGTPARIITIKTDHTNTPATIIVAEIQREITNSSQLNKEITVQVKDNIAAVTAADPAFTVLPEALYTVSTETPKSGGYYTVSLKPGEYTKSIRITISNPASLNPRLKYALGFSIESAGVNGEVSAQSSLVARITTNNKWDGVYLNIGNAAAPGNGFKDVSNPAFVWYGIQKYSLVTIGPTSCVVINDDYNFIMGDNYLWPGYLFRDGVGINYYATSYGLIVNFDSVTNKITEVHNCYADVPFMLSWTWPGNFDWGFNVFCISGSPIYATCNTRRAVLDPTGINAMQPNQDIVIKHFMLQPSVVPVSPNIRCYFDETWKYLRPR